MTHIDLLHRICGKPDKGYNDGFEELPYRMLRRDLHALDLRDLELTIAAARHGGLAAPAKRLLEVGMELSQIGFGFPRA